MKNLKKVLALVVALTMVLGTVSFAAFTDVAEDSNVYTAVQTLSSLSILNGYEDGSFGPEKDITRAEFCAVVCRALGLGDPAKGATSFTDVAADHWASGYINLAAGQGIVNGYGNGLFGPEDNVTYEQAVKMLVVALGFEPMAAQKGGYPTGYLVVANTYGMTENVVAAGDAAPANRGVVAQLTYNALDIPMMAQTGFGTNVEYKIQDGNNGTKYQTLLTGLKVAKLGGIVEATAVIGGVAAGTMNFLVTDNFDNNAWDEVDKDVTSAGVSNLYNLKLAEGINADSYVGYAAEIFAKEVRGGYEVIAIMPGVDSETLTIAKKDVATIDSTKVEYFESATATKAKKVTLDGVSTAIINNVAGLSVAGNWASLSADAEITIINNDTDSAFDTIVIKDYDYVIVDEVDADRDRFSTKDATTYRFDFETDGISNVIVNKDGEAITLADFAEGDVLAVISEGDQRSNFAWIEVINLGQNVVTGTVTELDGSKSIYVDGVEYERTAAFVESVKANSEGTFYLTKSGKIFDVEISASVAGNFGYILEADFGKVGAFSDTWQIRMITKDGKVDVYTVADKLAVNSDAYTHGEGLVAYSSAQPAELAAIKADGNSFKANYNNKMVTYRLDANNKIKELKFLDAAKVSVSGEYNADAQTVDKKLLADDAVIVNIDTTSMDSVSVVSVSSLVDEADYTGYVVKVDPLDVTDTDYDFFVIYDGQAAIDYTQDLAIVSAKSTVLVNDDNATKISYYTSNDETLKEITIDGETSFEAGSLSDLDKGAVFMFAEKGEGIASHVAVVAKQVSGAYQLLAGASKAALEDDDNQFVAGYIVEMASRNGGRVVDYNGFLVEKRSASDASATSSADTIVVKSGVNAYTFVNNSTPDRAYIAVADWQADEVYKEELDLLSDGVTPAGTSDKTYFIARLYNGSVVDIITLGDRVNN